MDIINSSCPPSTLQPVAWLAGLRAELALFMASLQLDQQPGRFFPCRQGATEAGRLAALGFSCFANKIFYTVGLWDLLSLDERQAWLDFIRSYQEEEIPHAFVDVYLIDAINMPKISLRRRIWQLLPGIQVNSPKIDAMQAETKQAIATLAQHGATPRHPFRGFPLTLPALNARLRSFNWSLPWQAGAQTALLSVFIQTQGPLLEHVDASDLAKGVARFLDTMVNKETGGYFLPPTVPPRGQLINGSMKVLNALDWLGVPIHHPNALIDTCLQQGPPPAGCHVVDWVYVVHRCLGQTDHRRHEIQDQCLKILHLIRTHQHKDGGFSYAPGKAQSGYYGADISKGLDEGDIHGTCLLTWAIAMIIDILEIPDLGWKIIRP